MSSFNYDKEMIPNGFVVNAEKKKLITNKKNFSLLFSFYTEFAKATLFAENWGLEFER